MAWDLPTPWGAYDLPQKRCRHRQHPGHRQPSGDCPPCRLDSGSGKQEQEEHSCLNPEHGHIRNPVNQHSQGNRSNQNALFPADVILVPQVQLPSLANHESTQQTGTYNSEVQQCVQQQIVAVICIIAAKLGIGQRIGFRAPAKQRGFHNSLERSAPNGHTASKGILHIPQPAPASQEFLQPVPGKRR